MTITLAKEGAAWLERAYTKDHPDVDRNTLAIELAELYWDLYAEDRELGTR